MNNLPNGVVIDEPTEDLHILAGLVAVGVNEDGDMEWLGNKLQWQKYEDLLEAEDHDCRTQMGDGCRGCAEIYTLKEKITAMKEGQAYV